jgi:hypothetical protein
MRDELLHARVIPADLSRHVSAEREVLEGADRLLSLS